MRGMNPLYPWSDGNPIAEHGLQYDWIVTIHGNISSMYRDDPNMFVAADNLIYPVEHHPEIRQAPDIYVAFGRPKEHRGSYLVFEEEGIFPQVVFEVRPPSSRAGDMARKLLFYDQYGAEEYYDFDPNRNRLWIYTRTEGQLDEVPEANGFVSPRLGIRFDTSGPELVIFRPNGERFQTLQEVMDQRRTARQQAEQARQQAEQARQQADRAEEENDRLRALLRAAGIDPDRPPTG
jgi:Uma2 family endonuclease